MKNEKVNEPVRYEGNLVHLKNKKEKHQSCISKKAGITFLIFIIKMLAMKLKRVQCIGLFPCTWLKYDPQYPI